MQPRKAEVVPASRERSRYLEELQRRIDRCAASIEEFERALDSFESGSDLKVMLPVVMRFDTNNLVLGAVLSALVDRN